MVVFPEGTRSRGKSVGEFKAGAVRPAIEAEAEILPVTIDGTADLLERQGYLKSAPVFMIVHPSLRPGAYRQMNRPALAQHLRAVIVSALRQRPRP